MKLTKRAVDAAQPRGRDYFVWCDALPGFGLRIFASGKKSYCVQWKRDGRTRRLSLGLHGPLTPESARRRAVEELAVVMAGGDPAASRAEARRDPTIAELCDRWLADGAAHLKPSTREVYESAINRHIKPLIGKRKLRSLTAGDVVRFQAQVAAGSTATDEKTGFRGRARVTGGKTMAARAVAYLSSILGFAVRDGLRPDNPALGVKRFKSENRERFLSQDEMARLGAVLVAMKDEGANQQFIAAVWLLLLTGCRKREICGLKWDEVDFERGYLRLADSKTGRKAVPLGEAALQALSNLPRTSSFVLPSSRSHGPIVGLQKFWDVVRRRAGLDSLRVHDLRHSFASTAVAGGDSLFLVGKVLGHRQVEMTARYSHVRDDPLRAVADRASAEIHSAMTSGQSDAVVVPMKRR